MSTQSSKLVVSCRFLYLCLPGGQGCIIVPPGLEIGHFLVEMAPPGLGTWETYAKAQVLHYWDSVYQGSGVTGVLIPTQRRWQEILKFKRHKIESRQLKLE